MRSNPFSNQYFESFHVHAHPQEISLLERGLSFIPTPRVFKQDLLFADLHQYHRRLKILSYFDFEAGGEVTPFQGASMPESSISLPLREHIERDWAAARNIISAHTHTDIPSNLTIGEQRALARLKHNEHIVIKPADKGFWIKPSTYRSV